MLDIMDKKSHITAIFMISMFTLLIPVYLYLLLKWYKLRHHFVIQNRFPRISIAVFISSIFAQLASFTLLFINVTGIYLISMSLPIATVGLIFYRVRLIYVQWSINTKYLKKVTQSPSNMDDDRKSTHPSSFLTNAIFVILVIILPVMMFLVELVHRSQYIASLYFSQMIIGVLLLVHLFRSNVSESLNCIKESLICIMWTFALSFLPPILYQVVPAYVDVYTIGGTSASAMIGWSSLYIGIHLIHKVERSKKDKKVAFPSPIVLGGLHTLSQASIHFNDVSTMMSSVNIVVSQPATSPTLSISTTATPEDMVRVDKYEYPSSVNLDVALPKFLKTQLHYQLFAGYLSECFALENLMFLERGIILYHMILRYKKLNSAFVPKKKEPSKAKKFEHPLYNLSFDYLPHLYDDMERVIVKDVELSTESERMVYKQGILNVMKVISNTCCSQKSEIPINVSYDVQNNLKVLLEDADEQRLCAMFDDYDALLEVYHEAIVEIWDICECVYDFQFKTYCKNLTK